MDCTTQITPHRLHHEDAQLVPALHTIGCTTQMAPHVLHTIRHRALSTSWSAPRLVRPCRPEAQRGCKALEGP
eukprot:969007-Pyramimonas_sp.AAC.1